MIDRLKISECCGCNVCEDACPKKAISFVKDGEGFLNPVIDHELCIDCGICDKVCPAINIDELKKNDFEKPQCFAAVHKNLEVRFDSTSGGAFSALAKKAYLQKYYVGGAIWNEDWSVSHFISNNKKDLERLRSSKYIQSDARGFYKQVKELLVAGEKVLLCGTPCQIAALKAYLKKDYENLITVDFICNYVNSPLLWEKYIEHLEKEHGSKVVYIKDKNKELGWRTLCTKVVFENEDTVYETRYENSFRRCYMELGVGARPSCYECKFKGFPRIADITIADFWGVEKYLPQEFDNNLGSSLIMCNSQKGLDYFDEGVKKYLEVQSVGLDMTLGGNSALTRPFNPGISVDREKFYEDLRKGDIKDVVDDYSEKYLGRGRKNLSTKKKCLRILGFFRRAWKISRGNLYTFGQNIYFNWFCKNVETDILAKAYLKIHPHTIFQIDKSAKIIVKGVVEFGETYTPKEKKYTKLRMLENSTLDCQGSYKFFSGSDVQIRKGATLTIEGGGDTNMNVEIVCGEHITFQKYVSLGRNVVIRDTNGEHFISRQGYKYSRPVVLGTHCWICDRATIMPGVHVYPGGIVGANSFVVTDVPPFSMVSGNPAKVVDEEVYWKE